MDWPLSLVWARLEPQKGHSSDSSLSLLLSDWRSGDWGMMAVALSVSGMDELFDGVRNKEECSGCSLVDWLRVSDTSSLGGGKESVDESR